MKKNKSAVPDTIYEQLQNAFNDFQVRSEKLSRAYGAMQDDFKKINLELDRKNRELEESLLKQEEMQTYLNSILESMNNGVISVDNVGTINQFNRAASEITGYDQSLVLGKQYQEVFRDSPLSEKNVMSVLDSGKGYMRDEKVMWRKDGHPIDVSFQSALLKDLKGRRLGAVEIFNDISKIKELEEQMQRNRTMAALGEMAATVVHEIRNPLGAMGVWASLLDREFDKNDARRGTLSKIINALSRLNRIVSNLLVYSRPIKSQFRKVVLQEILNETVNFIDIEAERAGSVITIKKELNEQDPIQVLADPEKLQQLVINLCLNAVQAMPDGGALTVSCEKPKAADKGFACFAIADTGKGIEKESLHKIFDPFYTTKENGTGLGLAIVKKFVDHHSGHLNVTSKVNEGTTVQVFLPHV